MKQNNTPATDKEVNAFSLQEYINLKNENDKLVNDVKVLRGALSEWMKYRVTYMAGVPIIDANNKNERAAIVKLIEALNQTK